MLNFLANWRRRRDTIRELSRLSDRELTDLGIFRVDIPALARLGTDVHRDEIESILNPVHPVSRHVVYAAHDAEDPQRIAA